MSSGSHRGASQELQGILQDHEAQQAEHAQVQLSARSSPALVSSSPEPEGGLDTQLESSNVSQQHVEQDASSEAMLIPPLGAGLDTLDTASQQQPEHDASSETMLPPPLTRSVSRHNSGTLLSTDRCFGIKSAYTKPEWQAVCLATTLALFLALTGAPGLNQNRAHTVRALYLVHEGMAQVGFALPFHCSILHAICSGIESA